MHDQLVQQFAEFCRFLVARSCQLGIAHLGFFDRRHVGQCQLGDDGLDIRNRINFTRHVDDVVVFKTTHHIQDAVSLADIREKLVAQTFTLGSTCHQAGNVDKLGNGILHFLRLDDRLQHLHACVWHLDNSDIRLYRAKRIIRCFYSRLGQRIEQGGLAHIGQTDNSTFKTHDFSL